MEIYGIRTEDEIIQCRYEYVVIHIQKSGDFTSGLVRGFNDFDFVQI